MGVMIPKSCFGLLLSNILIYMFEEFIQRDQLAFALGELEMNVANNVDQCCQHYVRQAVLCPEPCFVESLQEVLERLVMLQFNTEERCHGSLCILTR